MQGKTRELPQNNLFPQVNREQQHGNYKDGFPLFTVQH